MALRSSKISSEIVQTCYKYFSKTAEGGVKTTSPMRYRISNVMKPEGLPDLNFKEEGTLFADLQPSAKPEFQFDCPVPKWVENAKDTCPFPTKIKPNHCAYTHTDQHKAEEKMIKYKTMTYPTQVTYPTRQYSSFRRYFSGKAPAHNSGDGECKKKINKCAHKEKDNRQCKLNKNCPRFKIPTCEQSKGSDCRLNYLDPNCVKKFAPYPSYSESCAEKLPDDPSECQQCPWRSCDGADTIEPGKPVKNRREYSTMSYRHINATTGVQPGFTGRIEEFLVKRPGCGKSKSPCQQPMGPCEVRRLKEDAERKKREPPVVPPRPKKHAISLESNEASWIDLDLETNTAMEMKRKYPHCDIKRKPKRPPEGKHSGDDDEVLIEYGTSKWWKGTNIQKPVLLEILELKMKKDKPIKGDEGNPPPCDQPQNPSHKCPEEPLKKPKYGKRPMYQGIYKRPEDPYNKSE